MIRTFILVFFILNFSMLCVNGRVSAQTTISYGDTVEGTIDPYTEVDEYEFNATSADVITIRFAKTSGTLAPKVELYDPSDTKISTSTSGVLDKALSSNGTYTIQMMNSYGTKTGDYALSLQNVITPEGAVQLDYGEDAEGEIGTYASIVAYTFNGTNTDKVTIRAGEITNDAGYFEPYLDLYAPNGTKLTSSSSGELNRNLTVTGSYCILVSDSSRNGAGTYAIATQSVNNPAGAESISYGIREVGQIPTYASIAVYTLGVNASDRLLLRSAVVNTTAGSFGPKLELYASNGTLAAQTPTNELIHQANSSGTYVLLVTDYSRNGAGNFSAYVQRLNDPGNAIPLEYGDTASGIIDTEATTITYTFNATAGDKLLITAGETSGDFYAEVELYNASGYLLKSSGTSGVLKESQNITSSGPYLLLVQDVYLSDTGTYDLSLQSTNAPAGVAEPVYDENTDMETTAFSEIDVFNLSVNASETITFCSEDQEITAGSAFMLRVEIYNTTGDLIDWWVDSLQHNFTDAGDYYLFLYDDGSSAQGIYRYRLMRSAESCLLIDLLSPDVELYTPQNGEVVASGENYTITWNTLEVNADYHEIRLSNDSGATYPTVLAANVSGSTESYVWPVPANLSSTTARIKVTCYDESGNYGYDTNDADFAIINTTMPANTTNVTYQYDTLNRLIQSNTSSVILDYTYDAMGNRLNLTTY